MIYINKTIRIILRPDNNYVMLFCFLFPVILLSFKLNRNTQNVSLPIDSQIVCQDVNYVVNLYSDLFTVDYNNMQGY